MRLVLGRHYPVCDDNGKLLGVVRGQTLFEEQAFEIAAQVGSMVGVEKEERLVTPLNTSFKFRYPWLQINLATAFVAGAVVAIFQDTVDRLVILALFLPVLAGQSGNTGCQALAVTLRGMTLGELKAGAERALVLKEASLGALNSAFTGLVAALGMFIVASYQHNPNALILSFVVWIALVGSCVASGISGAMVPLTLKRFGFDPATASSIFLTTATDVVSMGLLLGLASKKAARRRPLYVLINCQPMSGRVKHLNLQAAFAGLRFFACAAVACIAAYAACAAASASPTCTA